MKRKSVKYKTPKITSRKVKLKLFTDQFGVFNPFNDFYSDLLAQCCPSGYSDRRLKKNIKPVAPNLRRLEKLNVVSFEWKKNADFAGKKGKQTGVIAQEVEKVFPRLVTTSPETGYKIVNYGKLISLLLTAVKTYSIREKILISQVAQLTNSQSTQ